MELLQANLSFVLQTFGSNRFDPLRFHQEDMQMAYQSQRAMNYLNCAEKKPLRAGRNAVWAVKMALFPAPRRRA
jgi:hypothetical protein